MSCLLPQFKCSPDTFSVKRTPHHHHHQSGIHITKVRHSVHFRTQCVLSTASPSASTATILDIEKLELPSLDLPSDSIATDRSWKPPTSAVLDMEKLKLPSLEDYSNSVAADRLWTYTGVVGPPTEANSKAAFPAETLLTSEEAVIAAAAAEAVALAKAALKVAKDAASLVGCHNSFKLDNKRIDTADSTLIDRAQLVQHDENGEESKVNGVSWNGSNIYDNHYTVSDDIEPTHEELELLQAQLSESIAVRSSRQKERKARRAKAAEKAAANVVSVKSVSSSRKKSASVRDVDYSDPLRYFRGSAISSKLLTSAEEQLLSEGIQELLKLERLQEELTERCGGQPTFAQWAAAAGVDQKTLRKRVNYGKHCRDKMVKSNIRLVISIAKKYQGAGMDIQDLVQEGCRGLIKGAEKFDGAKGFRFSTYAYWWVKQAIRKYLSEHSRTIRLPMHMVDAIYKVKEAKKQWFKENGRYPNDEELAGATGLSMKRLTAVLLAPKTPISLDQKMGFNMDLKPSEVIADPHAETDEDFLKKQMMREDLEKALDCLRPREKKVIRWRFGMVDGMMKSLQEVGEEMGVSRERVRQIELCAFRKLKSKRKNEHLQKYLIT